MIEAVVFDMDGILFDTERLTEQSWKQACKRLGCADVSENKAQIMGLNYAHTKIYFANHFGADFPFDAFIETVRELNDDYVAKNGLPVKPGVYKLLEYLKRNGYRVAAATSTQRECVMRYFQQAHITEFFDRIICGDMVEKSKPDPDIYLKAAAALMVDPKHCMALEDSPNGLNSAHRAGMKTVMVPDMIPSSPEFDDILYACVPTLNEVIPLLEQTETHL
jgi:HAD superfamily hydrolase (TIGR01509 family)